MRPQQERIDALCQQLQAFSRRFNDLGHILVLIEHTDGEQSGAISMCSNQELGGAEGIWSLRRGETGEPIALRAEEMVIQAWFHIIEAGFPKLETGKLYRKGEVVEELK